MGEYLRRAKKKHKKRVERTPDLSEKIPLLINKISTAFVFPLTHFEVLKAYHTV
jgi:hypothetical protein